MQTLLLVRLPSSVAGQTKSRAVGCLLVLWIKVIVTARIVDGAEPSDMSFGNVDGREKDNRTDKTQRTLC